MTYYGATDLAAAFRTVRKNTIKIANDIPEDQYDFKPAPDVRSVREMLVHIALGTTFADYIHRNKLSDMTKVNFTELMTTVNTEQARPRTKAQVVDFLQTEGERFASFLDGLPDAFLGESVSMM